MVCECCIIFNFVFSRFTKDNSAEFRILKWCVNVKLSLILFIQIHLNNSAKFRILKWCVNVTLCLILFRPGTRLLLAPSRGARGSFIGYSPAGLPLYSIAGDALQRTTHTVFMVLKNGLRQILEESDSRKIFYFLCINLVNFCVKFRSQNKHSCLKIIYDFFFNGFHARNIPNFLSDNW